MSVLLDVNVLFALTWDEHVHHAVAHERFAQLDVWHTSPVTEAGLVRLLMTEAVTGRKVTGQEALTQLRAIRKVSGWAWLADDASLAASSIDDRVLMGRRQVADLHLVNLAAKHDARLATFDVQLAEGLAPDDRKWVDLWRP